jgi:folylpolyglutamate synthase
MIPQVSLGLRGEHQRINASLAVALSKKFLQAQGKPIADADAVLPASFVKPLAETKWPGRCQTVTKGAATWLLDGAHTVESLRSCGEWAWSTADAPNVLIFNCSGGRQGETLLGALLDAGARTAGASPADLGKTFDTVIFCTNVTYTDGHFKGDLTAHAIDPNDLAALATQHQLRDAWLALNPAFDAARVHAVPSIQHAVNIVEGLGEKNVLVAGSLHLVGGVMEVAGLQFALGME